MYYGNMASGNQEDASSVWDDDYVLVMHLNENVTDEQTSGIHYDSTANGSNGVQNGNVSVSGKVSGAQDFDGPSDLPNQDYINIDNIDSDDWAEYTLSAWFNHTADYVPLSATPDPRIIAKSIDGTPATHIFSMTQNDGTATTGNLLSRISVQGASADTVDSSLALSTATWYYGAVVWEGINSDELYLHLAAETPGATGVLTREKEAGADGSAGTTLADAVAIQNVVIGNSAVGGDRGHDGIIDEVRISKVARTQDWLEAEYRNSDNPYLYQSFEEQVYVSGTVYTDRGATPAGSGIPVALSIEGGTTAGTDLFTAATDSSGAYFIPVPTSSISASDRLIVFRNNNDAVDTGDGAVITVSNGENLSELDLYQNYIIVRNDNGGDPSVADLGAADNSDADIPYNVAGGVTLSSNFDLYIPFGTSFIPGASVTTA